MDFGWFLTIPGMLISGGVILLVIALILFILSSGGKQKKAKDDKKDVENSDGNTVVNTDGDLSGVGMPTADSLNQSGVMNNMEEMVNMNNDVNNEVGMPDTAMAPQTEDNAVEMNKSVETPAMTQPDTSMDVAMPAAAVEPEMGAMPSSVDMGNNMDVNMAMPPVDEPTMGDVVPAEIAAPEPQEPVMSPMEPTMEAPQVETPTVSEPVVSPMEPTMEAPQVETPAVSEPVASPMKPAMETPQVETPAVVADTNVVATPQPEAPAVIPVIEETPAEAPIYGGADPMSNVNINQPENRGIYGGANPQDNTIVQ